MTNPNDLIRRVEALDAVRDWTYCCDAEEEINAIPAAPDTPEVLALVEALRKIEAAAKAETGHNLAPVVRLAQRIEATARAAIAAWEASRARGEA